MKRARPHTPRGFTIAEGAIGVLLVAGLLVSALSTAGVQVRARAEAADRIRAEGLAHDLMAEVLQMPYSDPDDLLELFGRGVLELLGSRPTYDDVDDYHGHSESPPKTRSGSPIAGYTGWARSVTIERIDVNGEAAGTETGLKRVTISVSRRGITLATLVAVRTAAWDAGHAAAAALAEDPDGDALTEGDEDGLVGGVLNGTLKLLGGGK